MRKVQATLPIQMAIRGYAIVAALLSKAGGTRAVSPVRDQRVKRTQDQPFALKGQSPLERLALFFTSKRGALILLASLLGIGIGARLWFRRQQRAERTSVSVRTRALLISLPFVLGIGIAPLVQWLVLPLLTLWLARRHLGAATPHNLSFPRTQS